jgi:hypothetical protein
MSEYRQLHIVEVLIRQNLNGVVKFLLRPHPTWKTAGGLAYWSLPTRTTVDHRPEPFERGVSLEAFVDHILQQKLGVKADDYVLEREMPPVEQMLASPTTGELTDYTIYPVDVWVAPEVREELRSRIDGIWLSAEEAVVHAQASPTARVVLGSLQKPAALCVQEAVEGCAAAPLDPSPPSLLESVPDHPSMDGLARRWFGRNKSGVRVLEHQVLDEILDVGSRSFNLRVADPYLRYQMQGVGFTWSFFTHKDHQDTHVHGAPIVEIYGVLEGRLEIWWKPYYDRGTSAWNRRVLGPGDWAEVDSLQCHLVHWLSEGKGVVFKAGPGALAEVGKLGIKGKTPCDKCPCMKPKTVVELEKKLK